MEGWFLQTLMIELLSKFLRVPIQRQSKPFGLEAPELNFHSVSVGSRWLAL